MRSSVGRGVSAAQSAAVAVAVATPSAGSAGGGYDTSVFDLDFESIRVGTASARRARPCSLLALTRGAVQTAGTLQSGKDVPASKLVRCLLPLLAALC